MFPPRSFVSVLPPLGAPQPGAVGVLLATALLAACGGGAGTAATQGDTAPVPVRVVKLAPRSVPELAGGHHERADGAGYPRGLKQQEMSPQARMMAIADVFEALTAEDRPYKKGKTLAEALRIMVLMRDEGHIDPELFALFVEAGVYRRYAERFLSPEQIDAVDEAALLRTASKA